MNISQVIRDINLQFRINDLVLKKITLNKESFKRFKDECETILWYQLDKNLPDNHILYMGILIEEEEEGKK